MSIESQQMRIVLASMGVEEFSILHATCEQAGHIPVAYAYSRSMRPEHRTDPYAVKVVGQVIEAMPPSVDMLLPANPTGLAAAMAGYRPDLLLIYGFNWILPPDVFRIPRFGSVNIHTSMLPRYRGPAPVLWAIRNGDPEIGVTVHRVDEGVDTGPILAQRGGIVLDDDITRERLSRRLVPAIADVVTAALALVASGTPGRPQSEVSACRAGLLEPEFSSVDWSNTRQEIHNQVRVFRYIDSKNAPLALVDERWLRLIRTSLTPTEGHRVECGNGPIWIVESAPAASPVTAPPESR